MTIFTQPNQFRSRSSGLRGLSISSFYWSGQKLKFLVTIKTVSWNQRNFDVWVSPKEIFLSCWLNPEASLTFCWHWLRGISFSGKWMKNDDFHVDDFDFFMETFTINFSSFNQANWFLRFTRFLFNMKDGKMFDFYRREKVWRMFWRRS